MTELKRVLIQPSEFDDLKTASFSLLVLLICLQGELAEVWFVCIWPEC